jgi:transposase
LARKVKQSSNWKKLKGKISRLRHKQANARKDYLHKLSTEIARNHGIVKVKKLRVRNNFEARRTSDEVFRIKDDLAAAFGCLGTVVDVGKSADAPPPERIAAGTATQARY